jgi:hypothetical protein
MTHVAYELDMDADTVRRLVRDGIFPAGIVRPGESSPRWTRRDLAYMAYRLEQSGRFTQEKAAKPTSKVDD